ncbi:hypothetical protein CASFOL_015237 [Castilleja foliolosa]|uniref:LOB domain-containing protein n=1 Tax=Castilleja foliolosa TaxID=1961234 RepID=A0ABD3DGS0_9LAMI
MQSSNAPCAACKYLRRKCTKDCVFAPYFPPGDPQKFINIHKVFGSSNVSKILNELNPKERNDAVNSLAYEAECRIKDPIYGCVGFVSYLQHNLRQVQQEIERAKKELATYIGPATMQPILNNPASVMQHQQHNFDPAFYQMAPYQDQNQLMIQEPPQQNQQLAPNAKEQEMLMAYEQQLFMLKQQELIAQKQQDLLEQKQMEVLGQKFPELFADQHQELFAQQQLESFEQQQQMMQRQRMFAEQQQNETMRFNDAGDGFVQNPADGASTEQPMLDLGGGFFETHYKGHEEQAYSHHQQLELFKKQQQMMQRQRMFAEQQQKEMMRSNDAGDGFVQNPADGAAAEQPMLDLGGGLFETHYQGHEDQACSRHQQLELFKKQQQMMQRQRMFAEQQQKEMMRSNDAGDGFVQNPADGAAAEQPMLDLGGGLFETHYQGHEEQAYSHHQQQIKFQELLLQSPQQLQLTQHQFVDELQGSQFQHQSKRHGNGEERGFDFL